MLIFVLSLLVLIISACSSEISAPAPTLEPEKTPPAGVIEETPKETLATGDTENGKALFISKACSGCHTIQGMPEAQGKVGPELTHQASNSLIVDVLSNTEENLKKYLKDPTVVKPGALMPNQYLTESEIEALVAFLRTLK
jgi:cytochrome c2